MSAPPPTPGPPARLGDYRILREVGRGGMGVVYEAVQESLGRRVAVKVVPAAHLAHPGLRERFDREARAAGRLHHTNIVPVFAVGEADGVPYLVMQFIRGAGLDRVIANLRLARGPADRTPARAADPTAPGLSSAVLPAATPGPFAGRSGPAYFRTAARLVLEAADALAHAHAHGVQHRDIKPANLLVDDDGTLWVTDFGLAKLADGADLTRPGDHVGTLRYCPPERFRGTADERADVYSLGATLYELLTLRPAFPDRDPFALVDAVKGTVPPPPRHLDPDVPRDLDTVALKCLEKDPDRRYPSAAALAADLRAFLDGRPITARPLGPVEAAGRWARRKPVAATVLAAAAVMLVGAAGLWAERQAATHAERAAALVEAVRRADTAELPPLLLALADYRDRTRGRLAELAAGPCHERAGLHARLALLADDPAHPAAVADHLLGCPADQLVPVRQIAGDHLRPHAEGFWAVLLDPAADPPARVRAAGVLAGLAPDDGRWAAAAGPLADLLVAIDPVELGPLARAVGPVLPRLADALLDRYLLDQRELADRPGEPAELAARVGRLNAAAVLLAQVLDRRPDLVPPLAAAADDAHLPAVMAAVRRQPGQFAPGLRALVEGPADDPETARRQAGAAAALLAVAGPDDPAWGRFRHAPDPTVRSHLVRRCGPAGVPAAAVAGRLLADPDATGRRALLLALADYPPAAVPPTAVAFAERLFRLDPDPGVHAAAGWALRHRWGRAESVADQDRRRAGQPPVGRGWFVDGDGVTFAVVPAPGRVRVGTAGAADPDLSDEVPGEVIVDRTYLIAATEVTADQLRRWPGLGFDPGAGPRAAVRVTWFEAAAYCNWLSERDGLEPCYVPNEWGEYDEGMGAAPDHLDRTGYRLPTEAEWEFAARAGCPGPRFFGRADDLLARYAQSAGTAPGVVGRLRPNDLGLFDVLGNAQEWADCPYTKRYPKGPRPDLGLTEPATARRDHVLRGGTFGMTLGRLRSGYRYNLKPNNGTGSSGFRLARTVR